ncbi:MAG: hypothetical protein ACFFDH_19815, partial [Promethearchaeota archaeon]
MNFKRKNHTILIVLCIILILIPIFINFAFKDKTIKNSGSPNIICYNKNSIKKAGFWNLSQIYINDASGNNWAWAATQDWCYFDNGKYIIENVTINGENSGDCILIMNSNVNFIIQNCTVF